MHFWIPSGAALAPTRSRSRTHNANPTKWTAEEDDLLSQLVQETDDWLEIAARFPGRSAKQVLSHWKKVANPLIVRGSWTGDEDKLILQWVFQNGPQKWSNLAEHLPGRIAKQCRERWFNHLDPAIKRTTWTEAEDKIIMDAIRKIGTKWADISRLLPGRTDNSVKNRWNSTLKRRPDTPAENMAVECPAEKPPSSLQQNRMLLQRLLMQGQE
jgi:hypothetical protein